MTIVIKKSGRRQGFSSAKLERSIQRAAKDAKLTAAQTKKLIKEISAGVQKYVRRKRIIRAAALRKSVLGRINTRSRKVVTAWRKYDRNKKS